MGKTPLFLICLILTLMLPVNAAAKVSANENEVPEDVLASCVKWGAEYDICPELLEAICFNESRYIPTVENGTCKGLMQINIVFFKDRIEKFKITDIYDIDSNIHLGADYLAELFNEYEDVGAVIGYYHGEANAADKAMQGNLSSYTKKILKKAESLERSHGK